MKYLATFFLLIFSTLLFPKDRLASYEVDYLKGVFKITIDKKGEDFQLNIEGNSLDQYSEIGGLIISKKNYKPFLSNLETAREKYWDLVDYAKSKKLKRFNKSINVRPQKLTGYFEFGDIRYDNDVKPIYEFNVFQKNGITYYLLLITTGLMEDNESPGVETDGVSIIMSSYTEVDNFIEKISRENVEAFLKKNP